MGRIGIDCNRCAACCYETIPMITHHDIRRIAAFTGKMPTEFVALYSKRSVEIDPHDRGWVKMRMGRRVLGVSRLDGHCLFLSPDGSCTVYRVRPIACCTYPFISKLDGGGRIVRLGFLDKSSHGDTSCTATVRLNMAAGTLAHDARQEEREFRSYWKKVAQWNRSNRRRTMSAFLSHLGALPRRRKVGTTGARS
jgi:Fe-S-cluster containining protein